MTEDRETDFRHRPSITEPKNNTATIVATALPDEL